MDRQMDGWPGREEPKLGCTYFLNKAMWDWAGQRRPKWGIQVPPQFPVESVGVLPGGCGQKKMGLKGGMGDVFLGLGVVVTEAKPSLRHWGKVPPLV